MHLMLRNWFLVVVILAPAVVGRAEDWPRWRGPQGDGVSAEKGWLKEWPGEGPALLWRSSVGTGFSSVAVARGRVFTIGNERNVETVYCLDATDGKVVWRHVYDCPLEPNLFEGGPTSTPTVEGDRVYTLSRIGQLFCLDANSGQVIWERNVAKEQGVRVPSWGFGGSPVVAGGALLLNVGESGMALDKVTGTVLWMGGKGDSGYSTPVLYREGDLVLAILASGKAYYAVDVATGKERWSHRWLTRYGINASDPVVRGGKVFISTGYRKGAVLLDVSGPEPVEVWKNKSLAAQMNPAVLMDGHLYGIDGDTSGPGSLRCVEMESGELRWSEESVGVGSLMGADGHLIVLSEKGELMVAPASSEGFKPSGRVRLGEGKYWTVPVLANGRIHCRNAAGDLFCLDVRGGKQD